MSHNKLKIAVLGLHDSPANLLDVAARSAYLQILAVADRDADLAKKLAEKYNCLPFDDYRQLVVQNQLDLLIVAAPPHISAEYIKAALEKGSNVLKLPPPARSLEETTEFFRLATRQNVRFFSSGCLRFTPGFMELHNRLSNYPMQNIFLITALCSVQPQNSHRWQSDPKLSGGGVLLHESYELIDRLTACFSLPQSVYALNTNLAADLQQRLYSAEDNALITMRFSDHMVANVIAGRDIGPAGQSLTIYGKDMNFYASQNRFLLCDTAGRIIEEKNFPADQDACVTALLENAALGIISPEQPAVDTSLKAALPAMAVIEAAYLSARTAMPEEPPRILDIQ
ncbi:MAG: Gfo/Idh/MocA family oxidoreductase [Planctomycetota bacterium]